MTTMTAPAIAPAVTVRAATPEDVPWLLEQLRAFDRFFGARRSLFPDENTALQVLTGLLDAHVFLVAEQHADLDARPVGFLCGTLAGHPFNPTIRVLSEVFWWVAPEHRGSRAGLLLLDAFLAEGRARADWIVFSLETKSPVREATLTRRGFARYETSYLLEVA